MSYLLFIFYLIVFSWLLTKIKFVVNAGLSKKIVVILFVTKVSVGMFNGWLSHLYPNSDTWSYHFDALEEYELLFTHPKEYLTNLFISNYGDNYSGLFKSTDSYWNDLKTNLMVKLVSVFHIFSGGNYYINVAIYNFLIFFGNIALFRVFNQIYTNQKNILIVSCFLLPSFIYFGSCIHKEGLILAALGTLLYCIYSILHSSLFTFRRVLLILLSIVFIFLLRNFVFLVLIPGIIAWVICDKHKAKPLLVFSIIYAASLLLFFSVGEIIPSLNLPAYVVEKQTAFKSLEKANSAIDINLLEPTVKSFAVNFPQAFVNSILRPFITDGRMLKFLYVLAIEILVYELIFFAFLFFKKDDSAFFNNPFIVFSLFFSFSLLLLIGYTTPILGAIVRYRSIYLPFILTPLLCNINSEKLLRLFQIKK